MKTRYSLIYAITRPEIGEQLSIGIILLDEHGSKIRFSKHKIAAAKNLLNKESGFYLDSSVKSIEDKFSRQVDASAIEMKLAYLSRYSNNIVRISPILEMDIEYSSDVQDWLFKTMVDDIRMRA